MQIKESFWGFGWKNGDDNSMLNQTIDWFNTNLTSEKREYEQETAEKWDLMRFLSRRLSARFQFTVALLPSVIA